MIKNSAHINLNEENLINARFVKVNSLPIVREHLTAKLYVDTAISTGVDESSLSRLDTGEN